MSSPVVVVATLVANEGFIDQLRCFLEKVVRYIRAAVGCVNADLHQDIRKPLLFVFHETWQSQSALDSYSASRNNIQRAVERSGMTDSYNINRLHKIEVCEYPH